MERAILTNMCMVEDAQGRLLVQKRNDPGWPGLVFPGGHVEPNESFTASVIREVWEETGIQVEHPVLCGVKQFYTESGERYIVCMYRAKVEGGEARSSSEGEAFWIHREDMPKYEWVSTFDTMWKIFENPDITEHYRNPSTDEIELY